MSMGCNNTGLGGTPMQPSLPAGVGGLPPTGTKLGAIDTDQYTPQFTPQELRKKSGCRGSNQRWGGLGGPPPPGPNVVIPAPQRSTIVKKRSLRLKGPSSDAAPGFGSARAATLLRANFLSESLCGALPANG